MKAKEIFQYSLGGIIVIGFFSVMIALINSGKYPSTVELIIGSLIAAFGTVVGYFYGSSKGSADKTESMHRQLENNKTTQQ